MTTLVIGDVHGCADELEELLQRAPADRIVSVGDLFTKGPQPVRVWELVREHHVEAVLGNHERKLLAASRGGKPSATVRRALEALRRGAPGWKKWVRRLPLYLHVEPWVVVHAGLPPRGRLEKLKPTVATEVRRWPMATSKASWWYESYHGPHRVIFGHDARRGLVDLRPALLGLDSGCVYGGALTGYLVEEDRLVSVPARKAYRRV